MRCACLCCLLEAALQLLRGGRVRMAVLLLEQALQAERHKPARAKAPAPRARKARARA
jgi:hypothetical protein